MTTPCDANVLHLIACRHPGLKSLSFEGDDSLNQSDFTRDPLLLFGPEPAVHWGTFTRLTSLNLTNIRPGGTVSGPGVVAMLLAAPRLKTLALECWIDPSAVEHVEEPWNSISFMPDLCELYGVSGGTPLKLRHLQIGQGIQLLSMKTRLEIVEDFRHTGGRLTSAGFPAEEEPAEYLEKLCDLSALEELSFDTYYPSDPAQYFEPSYLHGRGVRFAWSTFTPQRAPQLRRVSVTQVDEDFFDWMHDVVLQSESYNQQIAVSYGRQIQLNGTIAGLLGIGWRPRQLEIDFPYDWVSHKTAIDHLLQFASHLEGLTVVPCLSDTDAQCKVYGGLIAQLPRLRVFRLRRITFEPFDLAMSDLEGSFSEPDLILLINLVRESSSLRYIMVGSFAWIVVRNSDGSPIKLQGMSSSEWEDVELFRSHPFLHLYDMQKAIKRKGSRFRDYDRVFWSPRRAPDLLLPTFDRPRRKKARYV